MKLLSTHTTNLKPEQFIPFAEDDFEKSVVEYFEKIVEKFPEKIAIKDKFNEITYQDYNKASNKCARAILNLIGDKEEKPILFLADHSIYSMITILGILKSGNIYVALDSSTPIDRLNAIIQDSESNIILTNDHYLNLAQENSKSGFQILNIDEIDPSTSNENLSLRVTSQNLAVIFYTSGSTGIPKGVLLDHRSLMARVAGKVNTEFIFSGDQVLLPFPAGFGWSAQPMFMSLLTGATLHVRSYLEMPLIDLQEWLTRNQITYFPASSSFFRQFLSSLPDNAEDLFPHLRNINIGGEALHPEDILKWQKYFSKNCQLIYPYSSTECALICKSFYNINSEIINENLLLEYLSDSMKLYILDNENKPVDIGTVGQIAYRSPAMLRGYWNKPEMNSKLFIPDPEEPDKQIFLSGDLGKLTLDGFLELNGRKDMMVKIRGFRIDTIDVESVLYKFPSIKNAFVTGWSDPVKRSEPELIAFMSMRKESVFSLPELRIFLGSHLPDYMVPTRYIIMDDLPLNPNGKVDRNALPNPGSERPQVTTDYTPPTTELERDLCTIWQEILFLDTVGINDDYFELGGNSLSSLQMIIRVEKLTNKRVPLEFFLLPTISNLISGINSNLNHEGTESISQENKPKRAINPLSKRSKQAKRFRKKFNKLISVLSLLPYLPILIQSYENGIRWLVKLSRFTGLNRLIYKNQYELLLKFISTMDSCSLSPSEIMPSSITGNILKSLFDVTKNDHIGISTAEVLHKSHFPFWKDLIAFIEETPVDNLNRFFSFSGLENLSESYHHKKGVILLSYHTTVGRFANLALSRLLDGVGIETIARSAAHKKAPSWTNYENRIETQAFEYALLASEALKGQHLLVEGNIIQVIADTKFETNGKKVNLYNRIYYLSPGFAELALNTGAAVIPMYSTIKDNGHIHTVINPPFDVINGDRESQIQSLINDYVNFMKFAWTEYPESKAWSRLQSHLNHPTFD